MNKITQNTINLQDILNTVNNLPEAGGSSGSNVETCTVILDFDSAASYMIIAYTSLTDDGVRSTYIDYGLKQGPFNIQLSNIVCGSILYTLWSGTSEFADSEAGLITSLDNYNYSWWQAPTVHNSIDTLHFYGDE